MLFLDDKRRLGVNDISYKLVLIIYKELGYYRFTE